MDKEIKRGCGRRVSGGVYICTDLSHHGIPIDEFLFDPPKVLRDDNGDIYYPGAVGLTFVPALIPGVYHLLDWIGNNYYPFFPDFWEETRRFGLSRRISISADFEELQEGSQIIGFHALGFLEATKKFIKKLHKEWVTDTSFESYACKHNHIESNEFCVRDLWQLVDAPDGDNRLHSVPLPRSDGSTGSYMAARLPEWMTRYKTHWMPAAMYRLPIHRVEIINDPIEGKHEQAIQKVEGITGLPVMLVDS